MSTGKQGGPAGAATQTKKATNKHTSGFRKAETAKAGRRRGHLTQPGGTPPVRQYGYIEDNGAILWVKAGRKLAAAIVASRNLHRNHGTVDQAVVYSDRHFGLHNGKLQYDARKAAKLAAEDLLVPVASHK